MTQTQIERRSPHALLAETSKFATYPTGLLQAMKVEWEAQAEIPGRSENETKELALLLGRLNFELGDPDRDYVVEQAGHVF